MQRTMQYRSLFWPLILIGVGVIWLLTNLGVLSLANISVIARLWPLILIVIGLDLLFGRRSPRLGALIGIGTLAVVIVLMLVGPSLGLGANVEVKSASYDEPRGDATSARVNVSLTAGELNVKPLADSDSLFQADINTIGDAEFKHEGQSEKTISLIQLDDDANFGLGFLNFLFNPDQQLVWNVGLSPDVPVALTVSTGTGGTNLDLSRLQLTNLSVNSGTGGMDISLPKMDNSYRVDISAGTGGGTIRIPDGAALTLRASSGTGGFTIDVPDSAAVRLVGSTGTGGIDVPASFQQISGGKDNVVGESGTWETEGYAGAERQITIEYKGGTGGLTVK